MSKTKIPEEKKRLSLEKDRRNTFRENSKSSRKNIAKANSHPATQRGSLSRYETPCVARNWRPKWELA
jgi:hypothetical protein